MESPLHLQQLSLAQRPRDRRPKTQENSDRSAEMAGPDEVVVKHRKGAVALYLLLMAGTLSPCLVLARPKVVSFFHVAPCPTSLLTLHTSPHRRVPCVLHLHPRGDLPEAGQPANIFKRAVPSVATTEHVSRPERAVQPGLHQPEILLSMRVPGERERERVSSSYRETDQSLPFSSTFFLCVSL